MDMTPLELAVKKAAEGDLAVRIDENHAEAELRPLAQQINRLIAKASDTAEKKQRADIMIKYNPLAIAILKKDRAIININKKYESLWRGTREELLKKRLYDFDITVISGDHLYACFETRKLAESHCRVKWADGTQKYLTLQAMPMLDKAGEADGAFYFWIDTTDLHDKVAEAEQIRQRADRIIEENPYALFTIDTGLTVRSINSAFLKLTGYSRDEAAHLTMKNFRFKKNKGASVEATITSKQRGHGESVIEFPAGTLTLDWYYIPLLTEKGEVESLLVVYNDITERRRQEQEIQELVDDSKKKAQVLSASAAVLETGLARLAEGDLTFIAEIDEKDPLVALKKDYNSATGSIRNVIDEIVKSARQLDATTAETGKSTQEISRSTEQVAISTQESAEGAKKQISEIEKVSSDVSDLSASIEEIASTTHDLMTHAQKAATEGNQAAELGKVATAKMKAVEKISGESVNEITALNERMKEISNIVKMIADISSQTNLLALNAAIEAARAGEHGRGFAVVAGEVRNLAGESKTATNNIETLIGSIQNNSEKTAAAIRNSYQEIQTGIESVNQTIEVLNRIISEAHVVSQGVTEITKATEAQAEATNRVMQGMEQTSTLTHENQQRMEDMAALAEETSASTQEIASASSELSRMAERLKVATDKFKLR
ncbi:methyl-accepting chemotaxis sensory transducer [Methanoregula boonei 6A8]|uniref:Methyl-accepting chemotaxis sensory transducer n=1 Tax=Methanoregula boonei (strain DSM 21154 / JCM 14090 / 6A8) TaxID=456442 RepID=A7I8N4_METB6|nr:PAS domain-containing methyl-accepting chemotaxis protein [Methanoregula boonei]ABS56095.1 methyl-accepting chemotaxis sensory transducer [Methanoregula boonei 6A8]